MEEVEWIDVNVETPDCYTQKNLKGSLKGKNIGRKRKLLFELVPVRFADGTQQKGWYDGANWDFGVRHSKSEVVAWKPQRSEN